MDKLSVDLASVTEQYNQMQDKFPRIDLITQTMCANFDTLVGELRKTKAGYEPILVQISELKSQIEEKDAVIANLISQLPTKNVADINARHKELQGTKS